MNFLSYFYWLNSIYDYVFYFTYSFITKRRKKEEKALLGRHAHWASGRVSWRALLSLRSQMRRAFPFPHFIFKSNCTANIQK